MRRLIFLILICSFLQLTQTAQASDSFHIVQNAYFSRIPAFAIVFPQNEQPGDVYARPGVILARKAECFKEAALDISETYFPKYMIFATSNDAFQVASDAALITQATADAGIQINDSVSVSYGENGKGKWSQIVENNLTAMLENSKANDCRDKILHSLRSPLDNVSSIPWIIQSVWYATVNLSYQTTSGIGAGAKATIDGKLSSLSISGAVSTQQNSSSIVIAYTGAQPFPVAWRPAFISSQHYSYVNKLMEEQGWFRYVMTKLGFDMSDREILDILVKDFKLDPKKLPRPKDVAEDMSHGKAVPFEPENEKHLAYLKGVNALLGVSEAVYGLPGK
jgi:hypothetical protein